MPVDRRRLRCCRRCAELTKTRPFHSVGPTVILKQNQFETVSPKAYIKGFVYRICVKHIIYR